jgi:hypothetical protein
MIKPFKSRLAVVDNKNKVVVHHPVKRVVLSHTGGLRYIKSLGYRVAKVNIHFEEI